ncbi:MAG TPA: decaprenyl-phosphate phosphoribosyltransferase [Solirubrobacteraceae bacterium]|nr:decaprenyl-phosphate phosphoribosyltransferase [Solirubrobacteraceae bacterium]
MESANAGRLPLREGRRTRPDAVLVTMRPKQWVKNALVIAAAGAAGALGHDDTPVRVTVAFAAFCLLASGIYAINDVSDAEEDRRHPRKRFRPVAAGDLDPRFAIGLGLSLLLAGLLLCAVIGPLLALVGFAYAALTLSYTLVWRHLIVFDIFAVAGGFVLRAVAGGVAAPVTLSHWFLLVVTSSAVFVAAAKRYAELRRAERSDGRRRRVLDAYSPRALELIIAGATAVAVLAYCMWAFSVPAVRGIPWRPLTIVPFAICLLRYGELVHRGDGEAPEEVLLSDRPLQLAGLVWLVLFALEVHAAA